MFCSHCGAKASGNFCSECGQRLTLSAGLAQVEPQDWSDEVCYDKLIVFPEVRELIARHAELATKGISGEKWLELFDKVGIIPVPLAKLSSIVHPIYEHSGLKTDQTKSVTLTTTPPGKAIVNVLCSLARHGQTLKQVHQLEKGCVIEAVLPSDLWSFEGDLSIGIRAENDGTHVDASTNIKGQMFDWGKSNRCLEGLLKDIENTDVNKIS